MDASVKLGKYHVINHNGGTVMATIERINDTAGHLELADVSPPHFVSLEPPLQKYFVLLVFLCFQGSFYKLQGDMGENYTISLLGRVVGEVTSQENTRNTLKGNLTRVVNAAIDKDQPDQLILSAIVIMGLISP